MEDEEIKGLGWKVPYSIIAGVGWLIFIIIWLFFYASDYNWEKNVATLLLSIFIVVLIVGAPWTLWWKKYQTNKEKEMWETKGFKGRVWLSMILASILLVFLIVWFWYYAEPYSWYQNIAILIVSLLIIGGILGVSWAPWGIKYGSKFNDSDIKKDKDFKSKTVENEIDEELSNKFK